MVGLMADLVPKSQPIPNDLLAFAGPSETLLLEQLKAKVSRSMLEEISQNDYGEETANHLVGIERQINDGVDATLLNWCPREVLELERWQEPPTGGDATVESFERGHLKRMLACTILLRNAAYQPPPVRLSKEDFFLETSAASLVQLTRSVVALKSTFERPALAFGLWFYERQSYPRLQPFAAFCTLLLAATMSKRRDANMATIYKWVEKVEAHSRLRIEGDISSTWLIGLNGYEDHPEGRKRWQDATQHAFKNAHDNGHRLAVEVLNSILQRFDRL
jgi:hypothetical protein